MPQILAPAGDRQSFLAGIAAGADAIYCGLKHFSARMAAVNFTAEELGLLTILAKEKGVKVYVTFNSMVKAGELERAADVMAELIRTAAPDGLILQDPGMVKMVRKSGFTGEIHLSTLANISHPAGLKIAHDRLKIQQVVIPRELNIDEIRAMAAACPEGLGLEIFVHGALCYGVSGRCYWSSYMGGKSGLRGRCVQPCRRLYTQKEEKNRLFSCQDLSLDVLVKVLKTVPQIRTWKIEGRKKGPHYVYYTVLAYRTLRDEGDDPKAKKNALELLEMALGRTATHYNFLPQRPQNPVRTDIQTGSGLLLGYVKGPPKGLFFHPREPLLPGDQLRVGYEDAPGHARVRVNRYAPKKSRFALKISARKVPPKGAPVFLTDRREKALLDRISALEGELQRISASREHSQAISPPALRLPKSRAHPGKRLNLHVYRKSAVSLKKAEKGSLGIWLEPEKEKPGKTSPKILAEGWWWLPPVIWPGIDGAGELGWIERINGLAKSGAKRFVLNSPWQMGLFSDPKEMELWAGPFCNLANPLSLWAMKDLGFSGAVVSPELGKEDLLSLPEKSPLPLGIVLFGNWPLCISRVLAQEIETDTPFTSPMGEAAWAAHYGSNYWIYPNWPLDLRENANLLEKAGYNIFIHLHEPIPERVSIKKRPGDWNWVLDLS